MDIIKGTIVLLAIFSLFSLALMLTWNWSIPTLFSLPKINSFQAFNIMFILSIPRYSHSFFSYLFSYARKEAKKEKYKSS